MRRAALAVVGTGAVLLRCPDEVATDSGALAAAESGCLCDAQPPELWSDNTAFEGCAAEAQRVAQGLVAFRLLPGNIAGTVVCVPLQCRPCAGEAPSLPPSESNALTFASRELCPRGSPVIVTDAALSEARQEFIQTFGASPLHRNQEFRGLWAECSDSVQRVAAKVCFPTLAGEGCDEWSKYALPRCRLNLGFPYDPQHMSFLTAHACPSTRQLYCPPDVPIAIRATLKAGSRSTGLWAATIEGLLPSLVALRRALTASLQDEVNFARGSGSSADAAFKRFGREWIEHELFRLGCSQEDWHRTLNGITTRHFNEELPLLGLPLALCPTCCREGTARLRVVTLRNPFARLASYWREWKQRRGHLAPDISFDSWLKEILSESPDRSFISERDEFHVEPAFTSSSSWNVLKSRSDWWRTLFAESLTVVADLCRPSRVVPKERFFGRARCRGAWSCKRW
ncbi:unnamed protein product [Symbiodinium sp. CCMP2456]|nr:unnamed protein product [Symbiodinium sp. CCMP2456]